MNHKSNPIYTSFWGTDKSTMVSFYASITAPDESLVTNCSVVALDGDRNLLMVRPSRGWTLPGGHKELGESPKECAVRELYEEASVVISNLNLIGYWKKEKVFNSPYNKKYPKISYQLLYNAKIDSVKKWKKSDEIQERTFIDTARFKSFHHNPEEIYPVLEYALSRL